MPDGVGSYFSVVARGFVWCCLLTHVVVFPSNVCWCTGVGSLLIRVHFSYVGPSSNLRAVDALTRVFLKVSQEPLLGGKGPVLLLSSRCLVQPVEKIVFSSSSFLYFQRVVWIAFETYSIIEMHVCGTLL
jgi:hypothetical protein